MRLSRTIAGKSSLANPLYRFASIAAVSGVILVSASVFFSGRTSTSGDNAASVARARLGDSVTTEAKGRGKPWINMTDGHELVTSYKGSTESVGVLARDQARPLSLASGDFDEDGMPDLVTGYAVAERGLLTLQRGNVDSVYSTTPEARQRRASGDFTDAPFLSPAAVFDTAAVPEILLQGDFNADGHADLIAGAVGSTTIHLLAGDGRGNLAPARGISLPGRVTALTSGEINRADGLTDLVVAIDAADGPKLMVFEGPEGAVKATPELLSIPSPAMDLALGRIGADHAADVAVAAGNELIIFHGRDRRLSLDADSIAAVPQARISRRSFSSSLISLAIGDFTGGTDLDVAVMLDDGSVQLISELSGVAQSLNRRLQSKTTTLAAGLRTQRGKLFCARVSSLSHENLVMVDRESNQLHVWMDDEERRASGDTALELSSRQPSPPVTFDTEREPAAVIPMRLNVDALSDLVVLRADQMSPSVMVSQPNATIVVCTLQDCGTSNCSGLLSLRGAITQANGSTGLDAIQFSTGFSGIPSINLQSSLPPITGALTIIGSAAGGCSNPGEPDFSPQAANKIELNGGNFVSTGLSFTGAANTIRDFVIGSFQGSGLQVANSGSFIEGNFIGLATNGSTPRSNGTGVRITSSGNTVGGTSTAARNIISSNGNGVLLDGVNASGNGVRLNFIGTTSSGSFGRGNQTGVLITNGASNNVIGGSVTNTGNEIASGFDGVLVASGGGNVIQRNIIEMNGHDAVLINSAGNTVGGTTDNTINGLWTSGSNGAEMSGSLATDNMVQRNYIGLNRDTSGNPLDRGNTGSGVVITGGSSRNAIGGVSAGSGNLIAYNSSNGILVGSGSQNLILSNLIFNNVDLPIRLNAGANGNQAAPTLVAASFVFFARNAPTVVTVSITVSYPAPIPGQTYLIDFFLYTTCDCLGKNCTNFIPIPLGQRTIGPTNFTNVTFTFELAQAPDAAFGFVNATATSLNNNTSQNSPCVQIGGGTATSGLQYYALPSPVRILDTRPGLPACNNPGAPLTSGSTRLQVATGTCQGQVIPSNARAIVGNATVVNAIGSGFATLYPSGATQPTVSNLNYVAGQVVANSFTVGLGSNGAFNIFVQTTTDFIVDIAGYYSDLANDVNGAGVQYYPLSNPVRLLDTRPGLPACNNPGAPLGSGSTRLQVATGTCQGSTIPGNARAIVGNATAVNAIGPGFATLYPSGGTQPTVSNLNYVAGRVVPNAFTVGLGSNGAFNIFVQTTTDFIVDIAGYFAP